MKHNKRILIPIDFSIESLNTLKLSLVDYKNESIEVVLLYAEHASISITELLFYSPRKIIESHITNLFKDAITIIKNTYETNIKSVKIEIIHSTHKYALINFLQAHRIDVVYLPLSYQLKLKKNGINPIPMLKKVAKNYKELDWKSDGNVSQQDELNLLFNKL